MIVNIAIDELKVGNFVIDIVEQKSHFNLAQPGHIKSQAVINNLTIKGVKVLRIDTSKNLPQPVESKKTNKTDKTNRVEKTNKNSGATKTNTTEEQIRKKTLAADVTKAKAIFAESKNISKNVFKNAFAGDEIDLKPVEDIADKTIKAIFDNPDALACVINIRKKDDYLLEHSVSVSVLITIFSRYLGLEKDIVQQLAIGAFLHDVGKIKIEDEILNKPGKLSDSEFSVIKTHVNHSINIINDTQGVSPLSLQVAAQHHEKLDAQGYPFNLSADKITHYGRMIAICDIFDALTANRVYKDGYPHTKAFSILRHMASIGQLDQVLVDSFIKCMGVYPVGSLVKLSSSRLAIVEHRNDKDPINPKVKSFYDAEHGNYEHTRTIDLADEEDFIVKGVRADDFDLDMNKIIEFLLMEG